MEDIDIANIHLDNSDSEFNSIIGHIEDIIMQENFLNLLSTFMENHYLEFDYNNEENKLIYMDIFQKYTETIEKYIEEELRKDIDNFDMDKFEKDLMCVLRFY